MLKRVLEIKPDLAEGWYNMGMVYKAKEDAGNAIAAFEKAISLKPDYVRAYCKIGNCRKILLNDLEGALKFFDKAIEINPNFLAAYLFKADACQEAGCFTEAEEILRKVLAKDESSFSAYLKLAYAKAVDQDDLACLRARPGRARNRYTPEPAD